MTAMRTPVLLSVNVGLPRNVPWQGKAVYTGIWKYPVDGPAMVRWLNIDGDGQGDTNGHGGEQRAVLVYQIQSYRHWQQHFGRDDFSYGEFGENLTVDGLPDDEVCIGDRYRIGEAEFEVTQPRVTCYRAGLRLGEPELPALLVSHHRPGFYMRVITEGHIQAGDRIVKTRTGPGALSVADADALLYLPGRDPAKLRLATRIPALSPGWQGSFRDLLAAEGDSAAAPPLGAEPAPRPRPAWAGFRPLRVTKVVPETATVSSIYLTAPDRSLLPAARAGQYLTLRIPGAGQPAPVRSYSLSSAPDAGTYRISVKQEPHGTASSYLHRTLRRGARSWTWPRPAATSSWTTAPARSCSSPRASASPRCWPCCTSSRRPAASARSGGCTGHAEPTNIRSRPRHTPCWRPSRAPASTCSTVQPRPPDDTASTASPGA
jgi:MOSC domain-containing protein YiiM